MKDNRKFCTKYEAETIIKRMIAAEKNLELFNILVLLMCGKLYEANQYTQEVLRSIDEEERRR